jgi:2-iminobutanoate/2-iminopropanoate deaminase
MDTIHEIPDLTNINVQIANTYSHVVRAGNTLYISGQAGVDYNSGELVGDDFESQARQAFKNLSTLLEHCDSNMSNVVKTTIWLCDANNFAKLNELYTKFFPNNPPARSTPVVGLPLKELHISIECIALV